MSYFFIDLIVEKNLFHPVTCFHDPNRIDFTHRYLLELEKAQSQEYRDAYIGQEITILTEDTFAKEGKNYRSGHTDTYVKAAFLSEEENANEFVTGKAVAFLTDDTLLIEK